MAEQGLLRHLVIGFAMFTLFSFLLITIVIGMGSNYGRDTTEVAGGSLDIDSFQESISSVENTSDKYRQRFDDSDMEDVDNPSGIFTIATDVVSLITTPFLLFGQILDGIFGIPSEVISVVLGLLSISIIFAIWRIIRAGD